VAGLIEADQRHIYGATRKSRTALDSTSTADLASTLKALSLKYSFVQWSSSNPTRRRRCSAAC
jgi:hypothetical protein